MVFCIKQTFLNKNPFFLDEKYDQTFGIKIKNITDFLELSVVKQKHDWTFKIKYYQMKNITRLLKLR
ncbi:hypothetical protein RCL_jg4710.t1 [Rhizophagus clarus]|uniref:Uncharacterized protein n=1 Tax=Rhizophagus clarus TaxID=94130 RepID=A0A8H3QHV4_9GLOM|nr:hypothetical protein RCL_jg4710.t1 [Rhizophagus clarus]